MKKFFKGSKQGVPPIFEKIFKNRYGYHLGVIFCVEFSKTINFNHETVNHQEYFVNPQNGANIQSMEASWNCLRIQIVRKFRNVGPEMLPKHLAWKWWLSLQRNPNKHYKIRPGIFEEFLKLVAKVYSLMFLYYRQTAIVLPLQNCPNIAEGDIRTRHPPANPDI